MALSRKAPNIEIQLWRFILHPGLQLLTSQLWFKGLYCSMFFVELRRQLMQVWGPECNPLHPHKSCTWWIVILALRRQRQESPLESSGQPIYPNCWHPGSVRNPVPKINVDSNRSDTQCQPLVCFPNPNLTFYTFVCLCLCPPLERALS